MAGSNLAQTRLNPPQVLLLVLEEFDKVEREFVKFPDNMCSQIIFMNIKKTVQDNPLPIRNSLYGILMEPSQNR